MRITQKQQGMACFVMQSACEERQRETITLASQFVSRKIESRETLNL
jgi:hypothetical protein